MRIGARDEFGWDFDRFLEVAPGNADQARIVGIVGQTVGMRSQPVDEPAQRRVDGPLVTEAAQHGALATAGIGPAIGHVGLLIPAEHIAGRTEVADLAQALLELGEPGFGRNAVAGLNAVAGFAGGRRLLCARGALLCIGHDVTGPHAPVFGKGGSARAELRRRIVHVLIVDDLGEIGPALLQAELEEPVLVGLEARRLHAPVRIETRGRHLGE